MKRGVEILKDTTIDLNLKIRQKAKGRGQKEGRRNKDFHPFVVRDSAWGLLVKAYWLDSLKR
jgi:hypothetical protein